MFSGEVRQPHALGVSLKSILIIGGARSDERRFALKLSKAVLFMVGWIIL